MLFANIPGAGPFHREPPRGHAVQFYSTDEFLADGLAQFVGDALLNGGAAITIATKTHTDLLRSKLKSRGLDLDQIIADGRYFPMEASEVLSQFFVGDNLDANRFHEVIGGLILQASLASRGRRRDVVAFGEMVALLWLSGKRGAAIKLERMWNALAKHYSFALRCAYPTTGFDAREDYSLFSDICSEHSSILPSEHQLSSDWRLFGLLPR